METENTETSPDEAELVGLAHRVDEDAFVELAKRYRPKVCSTVARFARSRAELEDLTQGFEHVQKKRLSFLVFYFGRALNIKHAHDCLALFERHRRLQLLPVLYHLELMRVD